MFLIFVYYRPQTKFVTQVFVCTQGVVCSERGCGEKGCVVKGECVVDTRLEPEADAPTAPRGRPPPCVKNKH